MSSLRVGASLFMLCMICFVGMPATSTADDSDLGDVMNEIIEAVSPLSFGAYGDHRFTRADYTTNERLEITNLERYSLLIGYDFTDWISLSSQWEMYDGTTDLSGSVNTIEMMMSFQLMDEVIVRMGRMYIPSSIENLTGEPMTYLTVNTSQVVDIVTPSGWADGFGLHGTLWEAVDYWAYMTNGPDSYYFNEYEGLASTSQSGRIFGSSRAYMLRIGTTGAVDDFARPSWGAFIYYGVDDKIDLREDEENPGFLTVSSDIGGQFGHVYIHALVAYTDISNRTVIGTRTESMVGVDIQAHADAMPKRWKRGKFEESRILPHIRYESINSSQAANAHLYPSFHEPERITGGVVFSPIPAIGIKFDYSMNTLDGDDFKDVFSMGLSWEF